MSKAVSVLSGIAVLVLLMVLGGAIFVLAASESREDPAPSSSVGTTFTYQGHLTDGQAPANGSFDLAFSLYDDPETGSQVGTTISRTMTITDGLLSLDLDFGSVFDGTALWLEIRLRPAGDEGPYTALEPRQRLAPTPLATFASIAPWTGLTGVPGGFADNVDNDSLASLPCALGQIPESDGTGWTCGEDDVSTGNGGGDINGVVAGIGLSGGGLSGTVTLTVELSGTGSADTVARSDHDHDGTYSPIGHDHDDLYYTEAELATSGASTVHWGNFTGVPTGLDDGDDDTTYSAGNQITLTGTTFDLMEGAGSGLDADILDGQDGGYYRAWGNLTGVPTGLDDGDDDTTYSAGNQITLTGTTFDLLEGAGSGLDSDLLDGQHGDFYRAWSNLTGVPAGLDDGDDDLLGTLGCTAGQLARWNDLDSQWECSDDLDTDTTYQPGTGLTLMDTTFAISPTYQLPQTCAISQTIEWNGSAWACGTDNVGAGGSAWLLAGNAGTSPPADFLGTTDNQALEFRVHNSRTLRLEPNGTSPNILGGYGGNSVASGAAGATIGGGGRDLAINQANGNYSTVDGGAGNSAGGYASAVGGGEGNSAGNNYSTASGGASNLAGGPYTVVGGGQSNAVTGTHSTIAGGGFNQANTAFATVGGGYGNVVSDTYATVSGGAENEATGTHASVGGGSYNSVSAAYGTIAGGGPSDLGNPTTSRNRVFDDYGTVGGGGGNVAGGDDDAPNAQPYATVGGGLDNAASGKAATVGGGSSNKASGEGSVVVGGSSNVVTATYSTVGGGANNVVTATYGTIPGGRRNEATGNYATVGGGGFNEASAAMGAIGGGANNLVTGTYGTIPGGSSNYVGGQYGFAAGYQARAEHQGSFVWSDATGTFTTTAPNQFLIDASGGVGIGTNAPSHLLTVEGSASIESSAVISVGAIVAYTRTLQAPRALYAVGDLLYAAGYATNTLSIWDVTDPPNNTQIGYTTFQLSGPMDLQVVGNRAYLASQNSNMLTILDVSDPSDPSHVGDTTESLGRPQGVHVSGKYAYVASQGRGEPPGLYDGLTIFDVTDAPAEIAATSFISTHLQGTSDVFVSGNYAYVTSRGNHRLVVFDVSDPGDPTPMGYTSESLIEPVRVHVSGIYAYVVAEGANRLVVFDVSNPAHITYVGQVAPSLTHPRSLYVSGDRAYVAYAGDADTSENCGLAVLDLSDPADIAVLNTIDMSDWLRPVKQAGEWLLVPPKPVAVTGSGDRVYVANERHDSVTIFEIDRLEAASLRAGELQVAHLEVADYAAIEGDLGIRGGLNVGPGGALIQGALTVESAGDNYIGGRLGIGPAATVITRSVSTTESEEIIMRHPTHQLDVDGEARFRVSDRNHLVLRSPNTVTGDDSAYIDFVELTYPDALTPSARIAFLTVDPLIPARTGLYFYTRGAADAKAVSRLEIEPEGDVRPGEDFKYSLGTETSRWLKVWAYEFSTTSDARSKENVSPLPYGLAEVSALRPVVFSWIHDAEQRPHYGLIAQEVREVLPDIVSGDEKEGSLSMDYSELVPVLVKAVQEQQAEIDTQAEQIAALEARLAALEHGGVNQAGPTGALKFLSVFGFGGLVLGTVVVAGIRRNGV